MPLPLAAVIPAAASVASQGINALAQGSMNRKTRRWNEQMYQVQRADALADWEMQNAYNSPAAQMERLRQAGLNPNLVYGHGADAQGGIVRSTDVKGWNPQAPQFDAGSAVSSYFDTQIRQQQYDNLKIQATLMQQEIKNKQAAEAAKWAEVPKSQSQKQLIDEMIRLRQGELTYQDAYLQNRVSLQGSQMAKLYQDTKLSEANTAYRLSENERASIRLNQSLRESAERILLMRANKLRAEAQTSSEYYRKEELTRQAILLEKKIGTEDWNRQLKAAEAQLKGAEPTYYEKKYTELIQDIIGNATGGFFKPGSMINPRSTNTQFQRLQIKDNSGKIIKR